MACVALSSVASTTALITATKVEGDRRRAPSRENVAFGAPKTSPLLQNKSRLTMSATPPKNVSLAGLSAAALFAASIVPEFAEAAAPGVTPSLQNLLVSVAAGGVIFSVIGIAVAGLSTFDPVKRR